MTSLRMRVVEAGALAIFYSGERTKGLVWDSINDDQRRFYLQLSRVALDGHLGCLAENGHEPLDGPARGEVDVGNTTVWTLIATLREDR